MNGEKNYAYLVGRVRVLERSLLTPRVLDALLRAEDLDQALRVTAEIPYLGEVLQGVVPTPQNIDRVLTEHFFGIVSDFARQKGGEEVARFFLLGFDVVAAKLAIKHFMVRKPFEQPYPATRFLRPKKLVKPLSFLPWSRRMPFCPFLLPFSF